MKKSLLIDGYNLIYTSAALREKMKVKPEQARRALVDLCRLYAVRRKDLARLWVVFDGQEDKLPEELRENSPVHEIYTRAGETADKRMARIVRDAGEEAGWVVVSNDRAVLDRCYAYGAERLKASDFIRELEPRPAGAAAAGPGAVAMEKKISPQSAAAITAEYKRHLGLK